MMGLWIQAASSKPQACVNLRIVAGDWIKYIKIKQKGYNMDASAEQLKRIADAIEEILKLVKKDMEESKKYYEENKK